MRTTHESAPGRVLPGEVVVSGSVTSGGDNGTGDGRVRAAVVPGVVLEAGGTLSKTFALGSLGMRFDLFDSHRGAGRVVLDGELGFGAGVGGERCGNASTGASCGDGGMISSDGRDWTSRRAFGLYGGLGFGVHATRGLAFYLRGRIQHAQATNVPGTLWLSAIFGIDIRWRNVSGYAGFGMAGFDNHADDEVGAIFELGAAVHFGGDPRDPLRPSS